MPSNKNFQKRITILDECFSSRTGLYTLDKLMKVISEKLDDTVSRKTIQNDIKYIKETIEADLGKNIDFELNPIFQKGIQDGHKKAFQYSKPEYALGNQLLSKSDQEQLTETLALLSRYRNREEFDWLDELFPRIETAFNLVHEDYDSLISYQSNRDYTGQPLVGKIYNQLVRKKVLNIEYKTFDQSESYDRKIHPYHLKQYNNRWFLFGYEEGDKYTGITNLALDRIHNIEETTENIKPDTISWGDYFDEIIGVSKNPEDEAIKIKLRFSEQRIKYVLTKPVHGATQKLDKSDLENRTILIEVIPNRELYQLLLSFGSDVEVLEPATIINELKKQAEEILNYYKK
ncbi:MAG: helix-turn-helix transcriptional regulator [Lutibacter sp.]